MVVSMPVPSLRSALLEVAEDHAAKADKLEECARTGERPETLDPVMEARRQRQLADAAREVAEGLRL